MMKRGASSVLKGGKEVPELLSSDELAWLNAYNERVYATLAPLLPSDTALWLREKTLPLVQ